MSRTGGTLSAKMISLVGELDEQLTKKNIEGAVKRISDDISKDSNKKIKLYVELFGRVEDMRSDIKKLQDKINKSSSINKVKLGVELEDLSVGEINKQVGDLEKKFKEAKTGQKFKLDIDFDFKGSASKIKEEMKGIQEVMNTFGSVSEQAKTRTENAMSGIEGTIKNLGEGTKNVSSQIERDMRGMTDATGRFSVTYERDMKGAIVGANASIKSASGHVEQFKYGLNDAGDALGVQSRQTKIAGDASEKYAKQVASVEEAQRKLNEEIAKAPEGTSGESFAEAQRHIDEANKSLEKHGEATYEVNERMTAFSSTLKDVKRDINFAEEVGETRKLVHEFEKLSGKEAGASKFSQQLNEMSTKGRGDLESLKKSLKEASDELQVLNGFMDENQRKEFAKAVDEGDIRTIKSYVEQMKEGSVESLRMTDARDKERGSVKRLTANMQEHNGVVQTYTLEYDKADNSIRQTSHSTKELSSTNKLLSDSFSGVMGRITQYFGAVQILQKSMQALKKTVAEIREIDARMTELSRVASPSINVDVILERSVALSKELGASVNDVVDAVGEMARTFGEFNEEQLLAITRTATLMTNVSELDMGQATSTLVGTMKAFNIEAEDSIKIVNSFNEVDNNFAISTDQIAQAMERAGATATTFGVEMEELVGDITAVGEVTQESGERLGTALRTIYSRITTHKDSIEILDELGISLREMGDSGPEIRDVSDILGELGEQWSDLNAEQQQNIGLAMAGRNRLSQFLALMNNQATAIEATTTAYNSQGSAMREQKEYMASYEYQMTVLGATATEVALTMEDKFVGDAMYLVTTAMTDALEVLNTFIDTFGFLPTVLGGATTAGLVFSKSIRALAIPKMTKGLGKLLEMGMEAPGVISEISTKLLGMATSSGLAYKAFSAFSGATIIGGVIALGVAVEKLVGKMADVRRANEDARHTMEDALETYNSYGNEVDGLIDRYEELHNARKQGELEPEAEREYLDLVNDISTMLPNMVSHVDAQGQAHLRSADAIREETVAMDELAKASAMASLSENDETFSDLIDDLADAQDRHRKANEKANESIKQSNQTYEEREKTIIKTIDVSGRYTEAQEKERYETINNTKAMNDYYNQSAQASANAYEQSLLIQESTGLIGDQTIAFMNADGQMENVSTTAQGLIRDYAMMNSQILENAEGSKEIADATDALKNESLQFGEIIVGVYDEITEGLDGIDAENAIDQFDMLISALPEEEFAKNFDMIEQNMGSLKSIIGDVSSGAEIDIQKVVDTLEKTGMESDTARSFVMSLGEAFEHSQIKSAIAEETLTEYNDELVRTQELELESFNVLEAFFGYDSDTLAGMQSHIDLLGLMRTEYGKTWSEMGKGQSSIQALADYFNTSTDIVVDNFDLLEEVVRGMSTTTTEYSVDAGKQVLVFDENISKTARTFIEKMVKMGDEFPGLTNTMIAEMGILEQSQEDMAKKTEEVNKKFKALFEEPDDIDAKNNLMNHLKDDMEELRGSISITEDEFGNLKLIMADGSRSDYLDNINNQLEENNLQLETYGDKEGNLFFGIGSVADDTFERLGALNQVAVDGIFAIDNQREALRALKDESMSDEDRETHIELLENQMNSFGNEIEVTGKKGEDLKLQFKDGSTSPWLDSLNEMIKELGYEIETTGDGTDNLVVKLKNEAGETIFETEQKKAEELKEKVEEVDKKVKEATEEPKVIKIEADTEEFDNKYDPLGLKIDKLDNPSTVDVGINTEEFDNKYDPLGLKIDKIKESPAVVEVDAETGGFYESYDSVGEMLENHNKTHTAEMRADTSGIKKDIEEINKEKIELEMSEVIGYNDALEKIKTTKIEILKVEEKLEKISEYLLVTSDNMNKLMTNVDNITHARNAVQKLSEEVDDAIEKMGNLYGLFSSDGKIDTSGIESASRKISQEADNMGDALKTIQGHVKSMSIAMRGMDVSFNITPVMNYRVAILQSSQIISGSISGLASVVSAQMARVSNAFKQGNTSLVQVRGITSNVLGQIVVLHRNTGQLITTYSLSASKNMLDNFNRGLIGILQATTTFKASMSTHMKEFYSTMVQMMELTGIDMRSQFAEKTSDIVSVAEGLPRRIGQGVRDNMSQATSSMTSLASNMVSRFKSELGIQSPSKVFTRLGGDVIDGLVNGLSGSDITNLGQSVFSDFSNGAISTINEIKGYMTFDPTSAGSFGSNFVKTSGFGPRSSPGGIGSTNHQGVDYAAPIGTPIPSQSSGVVTASGYNSSMGNFVKIRSGSGAEHIYMHQSKRSVRVGQMVGRGQPIGLVGSTGNSTGPHVHYEVRINGVPIDPEKLFRGFAEGGFVDKKELAWHGEEGLEAIIPLIPERRERGLDLWKQSGEILGMDSELIDMLLGVRGGSASGGSAGTFSGLDGGAGEGSSDTGTSGVIKANTADIARKIQTEHKPMFTALAKDREDLYRPNWDDSNIAWRSNKVDIANIEVKKLTEQTLKYRDALKEVNYQEVSLVRANEKKLKATQNRQREIERELTKLRNTGRHTENQRKKYNELRKEFESNTSSIYSMEKEIKNLNIAMDERKIKIYTDYINQMASGWDELGKNIGKVVADLEFSLDYLTLTDEDNIGGQIEIQNKLLEQSAKLEKTTKNSMRAYKRQHVEAVKRYGETSEQAIMTKELLWSAEKKNQDAVLNSLKIEKTITDIRKDVAKEGIENVKDYYSQQQKIAEKAIEVERKSLESAHKHKMSLYDKEIEKIETIYDSKIRAMDEEKAEASYQEEIDRLSSERAELMAQISRTSKDDSLEGRKRVAEMQKELAEVNKTISESQKERQEELYRASIEKQKQEQLESLELEKERAEERFEIQNDALDKQIENAKNQSEKVINDEAYWKEVEKDFISGQGDMLESLLEEANRKMADYLSGDLSGITTGYDSLTEDEKSEVKEDTLLDVSNSMVDVVEQMKRFNSAIKKSGLTRGEARSNIDGGKYNAGSSLSGKRGGYTKTAGKREPDIRRPKPKPKPSGGGKSPKLGKKVKVTNKNAGAYIDAYGRRAKPWSDQAKNAGVGANQGMYLVNTRNGYGALSKTNSISGAIAWVNLDDLVGLKSGGYTGNWSDDSGKLAMLHKKELVLNEAQTKDILNVAKIVDSIAGVIPKMKVNRPSVSTSTSNVQGDTYVIDNLNLNMKDFKGSPDDAKRAFDNMAKELKKRGRR